MTLIASALMALDTVHPTATPLAAAVTGAVGGALDKPPYNTFLRDMLQVLIFLANLSGGLVVGVATVRGLIIYVVSLARTGGGATPQERIRLSLGRSLALALEFQLGADILGTALDPSIRDITTLGAIVVLRTVLNYFLGRELREADRQTASEHASARSAAM